MRTSSRAAALILSVTSAVCGQVVTTNSSGLSQPIENRQPGLALHFVVQVSGNFGIGVPVRIFAYPNSVMGTLASSSGSSNWVPADGRLLPINMNQALFSQLGTNFGGNGINNFAVPDLRGRAIISEGTQNGATYSRGQVVGSAATTLTASNLPPHTHGEADAVNGVTSVSGSGLPFDSMQPSQAMRGSIIVSGLFPCRDCGPFSALAVPPTNGYLSEIVFHAATPISSYDNYYFLTDGALRTISGSTALFSLLGTSYGGNGVNNYALPDLRGRLSTFAGQAPGLTSHEIGEVFGSSTASLNVSNLPSHNHTVGGGDNVTTPTGFTGAAPALPFSTQQPTLTINYCIAVYGAFPNPNAMSDQSGYTGEIIAMANNFAPGGYLPCDGRLLSTEEYDTLFTLIGNTYGGNGTTTFALPDLRGRVPIGASLAAGGLAPGATVGVENTALTTAQMPAHAHTFTRFCAADIGAQGGVAGHDGVRNNNDFIVFISYFFGHNPLADIGRTGGVAGADGVYDNNDFVVFIDRFFAVCP
jgi:microcystin-dependent protein